MRSIGLVVSEEKMFENVDGRRTDGRRSHWYTISSPMNLQLRWAKKSTEVKCFRVEAIADLYLLMEEGKSFFSSKRKIRKSAIEVTVGSMGSISRWRHQSIQVFQRELYRDQRECVCCVFDAINWLLTQWQFVCVFSWRTQKQQRERNSIFFMCRDLRTSIYLDDNASINSVPVENRPTHKYLCWVFPWRIWFISKTTTAHVKSHLGFVPNNFGLFRSRCYFGAICSINFKKRSLEKKVFFAPIHQNI